MVRGPVPVGARVVEDRHWRRSNDGSTFRNTFLSRRRIGRFPTNYVQLPRDEPCSGAANLRGIRWLPMLNWPKLANADVEVVDLSAIDSLSSLWLNRSDITDQGLQQLVKLTQIEMLNLTGSQKFTERGLEHLSTLEYLTSLSIGETPSTTRA